MAAKPKLSDDELFEIATYLRRPVVELEIHAEMPERKFAEFGERYHRLTRGYSLPARSKGGPLYVWSPETNKQGIQLRAYFKDVAPTPPLVEKLVTDQGKWFAQRGKYRINHSNLVYQLFECGFVLGQNTEDHLRVELFMKNRFPKMASQAEQR